MNIRHLQVQHLDRSDRIAALVSRVLKLPPLQLNWVGTGKKQLAVQGKESERKDSLFPSLPYLSFIVPLLFPLCSSA